MKTTGEQHLRFAVLATDVALFTIHNNELFVRLFHVRRPPYFPDNWGLPGGLVHEKETVLETAKRLVADRAHVAVDKVYFEQLYTFDAIDRDPRGRVVAVAYLALVPWDSLSAAEKADTDETKWVPVSKAKKLAYDHDDMLAFAKKRLASRIEYTTIIQKVLHKEFTLTELERAYTSILDTSIDKRNFRKKILKLDILKPLKQKKTGGAYRPAQLYSFTRTNVEELAIL